jgi:kinesin family protein 20
MFPWGLVKYICCLFLRDNQMCKGKRLIPFRDSKLTRLFQRALNGKESLAMIVNVNPIPTMREETFHVLMFSAIAKQVNILSLSCVLVIFTVQESYSLG